MTNKTYRFAAVVAVLLTLCLVFTTPVSADASTDTWDGTKSFDWEVTGEGNKKNPYQIIISSAEQLAGLAEAVNNGTLDTNWDSVYLACNIDLNNKEWTPIGNSSNAFRADFDGKGHTISNLKITAYNDEKYVGFIGIYRRSDGGGYISNLTIHNVQIKTTASQVGALGGFVESDQIKECHVTGVIKIQGGEQVGGLIGNSYSKVVSCTVEGEVDSSISGICSGANNGHKVGGLVGYQVSTNGITSSSVTGISLSGTGQVGGFVGYVNKNIPISGSTVSSTSVTLTPEYANQLTDDKKAKYLTVGTFAGTVVSGSTITNPSVKGDSGVFVDDAFNENDVAYISVGFIGDNAGTLSNTLEAAFSYSSLEDLAEHGLLAKVGYCKVTFDSTDGSAVDAQFIKSGEVVIQPEQPTKKDHTFAGWYNGETEWNFETTTVTADTTLSAKWIKNEYTITPSVTKVVFDSVKVGYTQPEAQTVTITNDGNVPVTLTAPTSENYAIFLDKTTLAVGETALLTIQPEETLAVGNYAEDIVVKTEEGSEVTIPVSFLVYQPSSGGSSKPVEEPEEPVVEPETPEEPVAGEVTTETEVSNGGEVAFETPAVPETPTTPEAGTPSEKPAEPVVTGVVLPEGTDSEVAFIPVSEKPAPAGKEQNTKKVFEINVPKYEKGKPATVKFTMTVTELAADGKTAADVALWHQDEETGEWTKLVTTFTIIDGVVYFEAITFDFSPFAIVYEDVSAPTEPETPEQPTESPAPVLAVLAGLGAAVVLRRK